MLDLTKEYKGGVFHIIVVVNATQKGGSAKTVVICTDEPRLKNVGKEANNSDGDDRTTEMTEEGPFSHCRGLN